MEYTLQDVLDTLKDRMEEEEKNIEDLTNRISNNEVQAVTALSSEEEIRKKNKSLIQRLITEIQQLQFQDFPIPRTSDLHAEVFREMEDEVHDMQMVLDKLERMLTDIQEDII